MCASRDSRKRFLCARWRLEGGRSLRGHQYPIRRYVLFFRCARAPGCTSMRVPWGWGVRIPGFRVKRRAQRYLARRPGRCTTQEVRRCHFSFIVALLCAWHSEARRDSGACSWLHSLPPVLPRIGPHLMALFTISDHNPHPPPPQLNARQGHYRWQGVQELGPAPKPAPTQCPRKFRIGKAP